jgi:hypothetical protein
MNWQRPGRGRVGGRRLLLEPLEERCVLSGFLSLSNFSQSCTAGAMQSITLTALDSQFQVNQLFTDTVHFVSTDSQAVLPPDYTFTAADAGVHVFNFALKTANQQAFQAVDLTDPSVLGSGAPVFVNASTAVSLQTALDTSRGSPVTVAGQMNFAEIDAFDAYGNIATSYTGTLHFSSTDPQATLPTDYTYTAADSGRHVFSGILRTAGLQNVAAQDTVQANLMTGVGGILVLPAPASQFRVELLADAQLGLPTNLRITALDPFGNVAPTFLGTVHFSSNSHQTLLPPDYSFVAVDQGIHTFAGGLLVAAPGTQTITVTAAVNGQVLTGGISLSVVGVAPEISLEGDFVFPVSSPFMAAGQVALPAAIFFPSPFFATVDFGDASGTEPLFVDASGNFFLAHKYEQEGDYSLTVTASDLFGDLGSETFAVNVLPEAATEEMVQTVPPGQDTTITETDASATLRRSPTATGNAILLVASLNSSMNQGLPVAPGLPSAQVAQAVASFDIRLSNADSGDVATISFDFPAGSGNTPFLEYVDPLTHTIKAVQGSSAKTGSLVLDRAHHRFTVTLDRTSQPAITSLTGTVFTVSIATTSDSSAAIAAALVAADPPATSVASDTAASQGFFQAASFQSTSQLTLALSPTQSVNAPSASSGQAEKTAAVDPDDAAWMHMLEQLLGDEQLLFLIPDCSGPAPPPSPSPSGVTPSRQGANARPAVDNKEAFFAQAPALEYAVPPPHIQFDEVDTLFRDLPASEAPVAPTQESHSLATIGILAWLLQAESQENRSARGRPH